MLESHVKKRLIGDLINCGVVKFGNFTLKSGEKSDIYFDLRILYSIPSLFKQISNLLLNQVENGTNLVCGVPTSGIPWATSVAVLGNLPMIILRERVKNHGCQKEIEGNFKEGDNVVLIEDVVTTGQSIASVWSNLMVYKLNVTKLLCIIDRCPVHRPEIVSLLTIEDFKEYFPSSTPERYFYSTFSTRLWAIMNEKKTNLALSLDGVMDIVILEKILPYICLLKIHFDIEDYNTDLLEYFANKYNFLILNDRKYCDIGSIVQKQGCNLTNPKITANTVHGIFGQTTLDGLQGKECFLILESSALGNLIDRNYTQAVFELGIKNKVAGFIAQKRMGDDNVLYVTPGVHLSAQGDNKGQGYRTPEEAIIRDQCDIIIVGRGIYMADDPVEAAKAYRDEGWRCFSK